jgi:hypothetical protein
MEPMEEYSVVGKSVERTDGRVKVTGKARYAGDLVAPGMLHAKLLRSPLAHAKILNIDTSRAKALPGVIGVITGKDFPSIPFGTRPDIRDQIPMPVTKVHHFGEGVAAVAAIDEDTAEEALDPFVAMPDRILGEKGCAFVLTKEDQDLTLEELCRFLKEERSIATHKLPERLERVREFPMTKIGKIDKKELRSIIKEKLQKEQRI